MYINFNEYTCDRIEEIKQKYKNEFKKYETLRKKFVMDFSLAKIESMKLDDYIIGKGSHASFCYRLERELDLLGRILGSTAIKFGIYYSEGKGNYIVAKKWDHNNDTEKAFDKIKKAIYQLINNPSLKEIKKNPLSSMVKRKILFVYHPSEYINIFSDNHLNYFAMMLGIYTKLPSKSVSEFELQKNILDKKNSIKLFKGQSSFLFAHMLYEFFGTPSRKLLPSLTKAVNNINTSPPRRQKKL